MVKKAPKLDHTKEAQVENEVKAIQQQPAISCNKEGNQLISQVADRLLKAEGLSAFGIIEALKNFTSDEVKK